MTEPDGELTMEQMQEQARESSAALAIQTAEHLQDMMDSQLREDYRSIVVKAAVGGVLFTAPGRLAVEVPLIVLLAAYGEEGPDGIYALLNQTVQNMGFR